MNLHGFMASVGQSIAALTGDFMRVTGAVNQSADGNKTFTGATSMTNGLSANILSITGNSPSTIRGHFPAADMVASATGDIGQWTAINGGANRRYRNIFAAFFWGLGGMLARTEYNPGVAATPSTASAALVDIDAVNVAVTFTVPPSGNVTISATCMIATDPTGQATSWGLREGVADVPASTVQMSSGATGQTMRMVYTRTITGLVAGTVTTWKLAQAVTGAGTAQVAYGGVIGPVVMEAYAA